MIEGVRWTHVMIHHSGGADDRKLDDWETIRAYHMSYRIDYATVSPEEFYKRKQAGKGKLFQEPWREIAYHVGQEMCALRWVIRPGRSLLMAGGHSAQFAWNRCAIGFCFVGDFNKERPLADRLYHAAYNYIVPAMIWQKIPLDNIIPHGQVDPTDCPGKFFPIEDLRKICKDIYLREMG